MSVLIRIMKAHDERPHHRAASEHWVMIESLAKESPWRQNWVVPAICCFDKYSIFCCPWFREQIVVVEERWGPEVLQEYFSLVRRRKSQQKERRFRETDFSSTVPSLPCVRAGQFALTSHWRVVYVQLHINDEEFPILHIKFHVGFSWSPR